CRNGAARAACLDSNMHSRPLSIVGCLLLLAGPMRAADDLKPKSRDSTEAEFFENRVRPILAENCTSCHVPKKQMGGLRLDSGEGITKGGDNGPVVKPGDPGNSRIIQAIVQSGDLKMPPKKKLSGEAIETLTIWVRRGAKWPQTVQQSVPE